MNILEEANEITKGARQESYGGPELNFTLVAKYWSVWRGVNFTPQDVGMFNILQKIAREQYSQKRDNLVDIAGYARTLEMINYEEDEIPQRENNTSIYDIPKEANDTLRAVLWGRKKV